MNPHDAERIERLLRMAVSAHVSTAAYTLRAAALDGIRAEAEKQAGVLDWLRAQGLLGVEPFESAGYTLVMLRDDEAARGAMRGAGAETVEAAAASALVDHLGTMHALVAGMGLGKCEVAFSREPLWRLDDPRLLAERETPCPRGCGFRVMCCRCCGECYKPPLDCRCARGVQYRAHWLGRGGCWCSDCNPIRYVEILLERGEEPMPIDLERAERMRGLGRCESSNSVKS